MKAAKNVHEKYNILLKIYMEGISKYRAKFLATNLKTIMELGKLWRSAWKDLGKLNKQSQKWSLIPRHVMFWRWWKVKRDLKVQDRK